MDKRYFSDKVVEWYKEHQRDLPWRGTQDPYRIWLSEIILQQTRVNQGLPYYLRFLEAFPTVTDLARANEQQVLRLWQGLGYYSRARNLHKCAKAIVENHKGVFPGTYAELLQLPGIGEYTAAAIASFAFKEAVAVVDGNVFRVLSRLYGIETPINSPAGKKQFTALANSLIDKKLPHEFNQGMMEFGALHCTPKNPDCESCVFKKRCVANLQDLQDKLPVKIKAKKARNRHFNYFVIEHNHQVLMKKRAGGDIWQSLYDFFLVETPRAVFTKKLIAGNEVLGDLFKNRKGEITSFKNYKHVLSHQIIHATFNHIMLKSKPKGVSKELEWVPLKKIDTLPKPILINKFLVDHELL